MKRSEALQPLSREHHQGLYVALQLSRADDATAAEARTAMLDFFQREGRLHFRIEEEILLPALARHRSAEDPVVVRVLTDHVKLRRRCADLLASDESAPMDLHALGELLEGHIRHEERVLFPMVEEALTEAQLEELGEALRRAEDEAQRGNPESG